MALDIDGFAVMRSIAAHPSTFPDVAADAAKAARAMVTKQIKVKASTLTSLRAIRKALSADTFNLILDGLPDPQIKTLVTKFDKHHPDLKTSNPQWRRRQLSALAEGSAEPAEKPQKTPKARAAKNAAPKKPKAPPERLDYSSAGATRKR
jgi:hypothetical protein